MSLSMLGQEIQQKRGELAALFAKHRDEKGLLSMPVEVIEEVNKRNAELNTLVTKENAAKQLEELAAANEAQLQSSRAIARPVFGGTPPAPVENRKVYRDLGAQVVAKALHNGHYIKDQTIEIETKDFGEPDHSGVQFKTLFSESSGYDPESLRTGKLVSSAQEEPMVVDAYPRGSTGYALVKWMKETTFTNNAAERSEGGTYAESANAWTEQESAVRSVATFLPVTDEVVEDTAFLRSVINQRLGFMLAQRLDSQLLNGNGTAPNLQGTLGLTSILTQAKDTDPVPDAFLKGITQIRVTGKTSPSAIIMHPEDWRDIRLLRTAEGLYIWGNPSEMGPQQLWGLPVITSTFITSGTGLVGDFQRYAMLVMRRGIELLTSNSHNDFFVQGKQAIRISMRCALVHYRDEAFCKVTGI